MSNRSRRSAAEHARRQEQPKYLYAVFLNGDRVKYLSAKGLIRAKQEFSAYLERMNKKESDGYELKKL